MSEETSETLARFERGRRQLLADVSHPQDVTADDTLNRMIRRTGIYGLTYFVKAVLDYSYPEDIFGEGSILIETWNTEHAGTDIDPGIKWVALLRHAIEQVRS